MTTTESEEPVAPILDIRRHGPIECGKDAANHFAFDDEYRNLNHGEFRQVNLA